MGERIETGIKGLDKLLDGGFIQGTNILVSGGPGTGKTVLGLQAAYNLAKKGTPIYYLSFEQSIDEIKDQAKAFGWELTSLINSKKFVFRNVPASSVDVNLSAIISKDIKAYKPEFVVIDSITKLSALGESLKIAMSPTDYEKMFKDTEESQTQFVSAMQLKKFIYLLLERFKNYGTTNLLVTDMPSTGGISIDGASEFAVDTLVTLHYLEIGVSDYRTMTILKMRCSGHYKEPIPFDITDKGLAIREKELRKR